ncbi:GNAT family N-acetyltransferase [Cellulomonas sp. DKR-3]|uniref:GNAT family N-acetyltransferase n=1 Tax=Cellulomonas fulva TaxID=2835530 RepID=A0ABS5TZ35_9CELL|nr:GNAT family N-acetyltransferase [Cellulomonas fulva]MBT0994425.1 GNAT family N-acetyltransferase [Cellulomonas fulva]
MPAGPVDAPQVPDRVERLRPEQLGAAADVLAAALAEDPGFRHLFPDPRRREHELRGLYRMTLTDTLRHGHVFVTVLDGRITGAVALYAPGAYPMSTARWWRLAGRIAALALRTRTHALGLIRFGDLTAEGVPRDAWYVEALGVHPDRQLQGRGKRLMAQVFALIDTEGGLGYLETTKPENVAYYTALGYESVREPIALAASGPHIYPMRRARVAARGPQREPLAV